MEETTFRNDRKSIIIVLPCWLISITSYFCGFKWTKNGQDFDPYQDPRLITLDDSGTFIIPNNGNLTEFQGNYRCFATNKLGTAMSEEIEFVVPNVPKFPKEIIDPIEVMEGLQHIEQDERVSVGLNGNLYFSNAIETDSRRDYCCFAAFPRIRTIVQKTAMSVVVKSNKLMKDSGSGSGRGYANSLLERKPSLLTPTGKESHTYLVKGEDLQLECIAEGFPTPKVEWVKTGFHKLPERAVVESHGKLLTVEMVNEEDEGKYMCRAKNPHGEVMHYFHVTVEEPPEFEIEPQSQLVTIGADVVIKCVVKGNPQPTVAWRVNGRPLNEVPTSNRKVLKDGTISIHNAKPENSAVFQCEATNRHGTILANANIMIMNIQPLILTENNLQYMAVEGKGVVMHCKVFSSPTSSITWSKADSADVVEGERFSVHKNGSLEIHNAMKEDMGEYSCFAQNTEGKVAIAATLEVKDPTRIVDPPHDLRVLVGTTIQFSCQAEYDPSIGEDFEIIWEKDGMALNGSENARYILDDGVLEIINVSFGDQGLYVCVARTPVDQDMAVAQLSVVEFEESQHEPGSWREMRRVPGNHHSALLKLHGHLDYRFRVSAVNEVGRGRPSQDTERYKTPASAPDKNPENIKIEGHLPHEMDINWEPLSPIEHNGPGLEYKVSYRRQGAEEEWMEHMVKRHSFVVKNTPTFVLYEVKIQAKNHAGWGPDPKIITAYSGEDFFFWSCPPDVISVPSASPEDVSVEVMNNTMVKVRWDHVHKDKLNGHLGGYRYPIVIKPTPFLALPLRCSTCIVSQHQTVHVHRSTRNQIPAGTMTTLIMMLNDTEELGSLMTLNISADSNKLHLQDLEALSKYKFYLRSCTRVGCGPAVSEERTTVPEATSTDVASFNIRKSGSQFPPRKTTVSPVANATLSSIGTKPHKNNEFKENIASTLPPPSLTTSNKLLRVIYSTNPLCHFSLFSALLNISTSVSHNFANISWIPGTEQTESELYVAFMNNREGNWKISDALNSSKTFHLIEGLEPGTEYTVRLMTKSWVDNSSIFEDVIRTSAKGLASIHGGISNQGWFIGLMCAIALLTLIVLIACFVNRNKGGKYSVKEKEDLHPDLESQGINDDTFCEYSDNDEKPLKSSQHSLNGDLKGGDSGDSMVDYGDEDAHFNEDGSFIGEYSGRKERVSMEIKGNNQSTA
ncbi:Neural cell adhesion molecule L1 [Labeo rohita]|uniref:Neural cell adhesion molecule L1 n=1 Tax=Labeo rohita TaxID=84645 RepID=A0ABQ8MNJ9_LABRO|nr:Neural cell adhesion molecule L1 [Labeo rohita]